jgi:phosphate transport system substrate-binding protein
VKGDLATATEAAKVAAPFLPDDFRFSIANSPAKSAYPVSSFTYLLIPASIKDNAKRAALQDLLRWMLGPGQEMAAAVGFSRLPQNVITHELENIALLQ